MQRTLSLTLAFGLALGVARPMHGQEIDPRADRLPVLFADLCGTGADRRGVAAFFEFGSSDQLVGPQDTRLAELADDARRDGGWVLLTGHLDAEEARTMPPGLDLARAEDVRDRLVALGVLPSRIWIRRAGVTDRMVPVDVAEVQNRRVESILPHFGTACAAKVRSAINAWFSHNCYPKLRAMDAADCDRALHLLR